MRSLRVVMFSTCMVLLGSLLAQAQQNAAVAANAIVPPLVKFNGTLTDVSGTPLTGVVGVTFSLYSEQEGGAPLWLETQNVTADRNGHYSAMLGSTSSTGLPADIFVAGAARWLAVQAEDQGEKARVLLLSVPYALKAGDAQTLGGLPASAFVLAAPPNGFATTATPEGGIASSSTVSPPASSDVTTTGGTVNTLPLFTTASNVQSSVITQTGSGTTGKIGINTTSPAATLDVNGGATMRGTLTSAAMGNATATKGFNSQPQDFVASVFNSSTVTAVPQKFQWQAEAVNNDTSTASGTMNLLYASGTGSPAETGLKISSKGLFTFATGQTFPGTGLGTITGVTAGTDLTGGGTSGKVTLNVNTTALNSVYPQLAANNTFTGTQTINNTTVINGTNGAGVLQVTNTATSGNAPGISGTTNSTNSSGVKGVASATSGTVNGVFGTTSSPNGYGVLGQSPNVGVWGQSSGSSAVGRSEGFDAGVWGDTAGPANDGYFGVLGTADENIAGVFENNSSASVTLYAENDAESQSDAPVFETLGGLFGGGCAIDVSGNLTCNGKISDAVAVDGGARKVALYAMQSPENWFEDFGSGTLSNGAVTIALDPTFTQTVNTGAEYHVFLTPSGDCKGLYVAHKSGSSFEVRELVGGQSNVAFDYRIVARRMGYENVRLADLTEQFNKQEAQRKRMRRPARPTAAPQSGAVEAGARLKAAAKPVAGPPK